MIINISQELREKNSQIACDLLRVNADPYAQRHIDRFFEKTEVHENGCWIWTGYIDPQGYARFKLHTRQLLAYRWTYILFKGTIPEGLQLDHLCRKRNCVNPDHLEAVTLRVNTLRSFAPSAMNAKKTHCLQGHPFDENNTYINPRSQRQCRTCDRERKRRYRARYQIA